MHVKIITNTDYFVDADGIEHEPTEKVIEMPFELGEIVYTIESRRNGKKFVVIKHTLLAVVCNSSLCYYRTTAGDLITQFDKCFTSKDQAIAKCLELTAKAKIKVVDKSSQLY